MDLRQFAIIVSVALAVLVVATYGSFSYRHVCTYEDYHMGVSRGICGRDLITILAVVCPTQGISKRSIDDGK